MDHLCSNCVFEYHGCSNMSRKNNDSGLTCCQWKHDGSSDKPRTTEPRKTWLDECAMMAMQAVLSNSVFETFRQELDKTVSEEKQMGAIAEMCYDYADAMLAEKIKREAKE